MNDSPNFLRIIIHNNKNWIININNTTITIDFTNVAKNLVAVLEQRLISNMNGRTIYWNMYPGVNILNKIIRMTKANLDEG